MPLRLAGIALAQQQQRDFIGRPEIVRLQRHDAAYQRLRGRGAPLALANFVQHRQRSGPPRSKLQHIKREPLGDFDRSRAVRLRRLLLERHQVPVRFRRAERPDVQVAAARRGKAAAAAA